ncbi:MAG: YfhO family protein [Muribaculaceae bacterium]|nr:YfhO family protein [Muribaculaceae bacterium]
MLNKNKNLIDIIIEKFKHPQVWGSFVALIIMIIISFAYFHPDVVQGRVLQQYDMMQGAAIGQEAKAFEEATGEKALWTNSVFSGMPTFQISPSYSSNSLFDWINSLYGAFLPAPANLLVMMMLGFFILLLAFGLKWWQALIGAIAYGFSSYFIILIGAGHIWKFITLAYIPPTIAGIVLCYRGRYLLGGAIAALFAMMQLSANHVQMTYYFAFVIVGFVVAYLITAIKEKKLKQWGIATGTLAVAAVLALAANSPSLYNTYEYSKETMRGNHSELTAKEDAKSTENKTDGLNRDYITQYSYGGAETFTLLIPDVKGGSSQQALSEADEAKNCSSEERYYLSQLPQYFGGAEGTSGPVYVGAIICALFLLGCIIVRGPIKWMLITLTILSILLALGRNFMWFTDLFIDYIPMYSKFRTVESILVIAQFTMPLLALLAVKQLFEEKEPWKKYKVAIFASFGVTLFICFLGIISPSIFGSFVGDAETSIKDQYPQIFIAAEQVRAAMVSSDALRSFMFIALTLGAILLYSKKKIPATLSVAIICVLVLGDLYTVGKRYLNHDSFHDKPLGAEFEQFAKTPIDEQILADTTSHYRVMNIPMFNHPAPSYHHKTIGGYHAAKLTRYQDLINRQLSTVQQYSYMPELRSDSINIPDDQQALAKELRQKYSILDMLNAKYIIGHKGELVKNEHALGNAWWVDNVIYANNADGEMNALDTINTATTAVADVKFKDIIGTATPKSAGDTISLTTYAPNRLTYHAKSQKGGVAVFSEIYFPWGWNVTIDDKPVEMARVNYVLRALNVPAGDHKIEMYFDPQSIHTTTTVASVAVILIYLALIAAVLLALKGKSEKEEKTTTKA